ncbi:hypothetical protein O6H91_22G062300 [Diphasiastrum complanatum]|uniref:Uncharacterized protein n=1 Tax=Diphasiastrum complanatum TaxID=34168 RepID=A0ACC2AGH8_DIPCM|nr:hypothetical protein O6H91_22G062300 [Diphasiastrum complanatum]
MAMAIAASSSSSFSYSDRHLSLPHLQSRLFPHKRCHAAFQQPQAVLAVRPHLPSALHRIPSSVSMHIRNSLSSRLIVAAMGDSSSSSSSRRARVSEGEGLEERARSGIGNMPSQYAEFLRPPQESTNYVLWASGILILILMRKVIMMELVRWVHAGVALVALFLDVGQYGFSLLLKNAREPVVWTATLTGWVWFAITDIYAIILDMTPVKALIKAIVFSSAVLSLGEAVQSDAVSSQADALGIAAILGLAGVLGLVHHTLFTLALGLLTMYLAWFRKAGLVSAAIPATAVLVAVAEPIVQASAFASFLLITLYTNWSQHEPKKDATVEKHKSPGILKVAALAVGIRLAAEWLYARHLVWLAV